jgi:siroheme synthase (precorrin-2 oxidase/ferrochelatase)
MPEEPKRKNNMIEATRIDLKVSYAEREIAKSQGAKWDSDKKTWFIMATSDRDLEKVVFWLPADIQKMVMDAKQVK